MVISGKRSCHFWFMSCVMGISMAPLRAFDEVAFAELRGQFYQATSVAQQGKAIDDIFRYVADHYYELVPAGLIALERTVSRLEQLDPKNLSSDDVARIRFCINYEILALMCADDDSANLGNLINVLAARGRGGDDEIKLLASKGSVLTELEDLPLYQQTVVPTLNTVKSRLARWLCAPMADVINSDKLELANITDSGMEVIFKHADAAGFRYAIPEDILYVCVINKNAAVDRPGCVLYAWLVWRPQTSEELAQQEKHNLQMSYEYAEYPTNSAGHDIVFSRVYQDVDGHRYVYMSPESCEHWYEGDYVGWLRENRYTQTWYSFNFSE